MSETYIIVYDSFNSSAWPSARSARRRVDQVARVYHVQYYTLLRIHYYNIVLYYLYRIRICFHTIFVIIVIIFCFFFFTY